MDVDRVNKANIADLTESQCKQALLLACKLVSDTNVHHLREVAMSSASEAHALFFERQFEHLLADALTYAVASGEWQHKVSWRVIRMSALTSKIL